MPLSRDQIVVLISLERTGASLSLVGVGLVFLSYSLFKGVRTIPNLFIVFASIANIGASVACIIGYDGILKGQNSALCQAQAFLLEMFMQADPWWSLAMAFNVFLVFFCGASPSIFKKYLWLYCIICFGGPFIPALVLLVAQPGGKPMYGNATLWCWISNDWNALRIYTYYLPIWICILFSGLIYSAIGYHVFHHRNQLRNLTFSRSGQDTKENKNISLSEETRDSGDQASKNRLDRTEDWHVRAVTEVQVTTGAPFSLDEPQSPEMPMPAPMKPEPALLHHSTGKSPLRKQSWRSSIDDRETPSPATVNDARFETMISSQPRPKPSAFKRIQCGCKSFNARLKGLDPVKLAYLRTSFIFAVSILVTWTPSSINRINDLINPEEVSYGLNVATAVVLPLQGVWNAVIFFLTSWDTVKQEVREMITRPSGRSAGGCSPGRSNGTSVDGFQGGYGDQYGVPRYGRIRRPKSDEASDIELTAPTISSQDNGETARGSSF